MKKFSLKKLSHISIFSKMLIILILFALIPTLTAIGVIYNQSLDTLKEQAKVTNINMLQKTSKSIDLVFRQLNDIIPQISKDSEMVHAVINPDFNDISRNSKLISKLSNIAANNEFILSIYLYSKENNTILSSSGGIYKADEFYDDAWLEAFDGFLFGTHEMETRKIYDPMGNAFNGITLIRNVPYQTWSKIGALVVNINQEQLHSAITGIEVDEQGEFIVINPKGNVIVHKDEEVLNRNISETKVGHRVMEGDNGSFLGSMDDETVFVSYVTSDYNQWKYIYTIPLEVLIKDVDAVTRFIFIVTMLYILIGLFFAFVISRDFYNPLKRLVSQFKEEESDDANTEMTKIRNEYEFIDHAYQHAIQEKDDMEALVDSFRPVLREKLFTKLIEGRIQDIGRIRDEFDEIKLPLSLTDYLVISIQIDSFKEYREQYSQSERNLNKLKLMHLIDSNLSSIGKGVTIDYKRENVVTVVDINEGLSVRQIKDSIRNVAENIRNMIDELFPFTVTIGIGRVYNSILDVSESFRESQKALGYKLYMGKNEVIRIDDFEEMEEELYYYSSKEKQLLNIIRSGQKEHIEELIDNITSEITTNKNISRTYAQQVFMRILNSIVESMIDLDIDLKEAFGEGEGLYEQLESKETLDEINAWLKDISIMVIDRIAEKNSSKSESNVDRIKEYIDNNLSKDISLNDLADHVNLTPAYVSKIFKETLGKNYIDYLNGSRIDRAKQLLKDTRMTVKEIGFKVGFNNVQTFFRTFKRYEGITPGQFRENLTK